MTSAVMSRYGVIFSRDSLTSLLKLRFTVTLGPDYTVEMFFFFCSFLKNVMSYAVIKMGRIMGGSRSASPLTQS